MRVLLIGGTGQLGSEIRKLTRGWELQAPSHAQMPMEDAAALAARLDAFRPDLVINACGGFDNVAECEKRPLEAFQANVATMQAFCRAVRDAGARLVTFSTDYVFSGDKGVPYTEDDMPRPINIYGIARLAEEHIARAVLEDDVMVIRTCGVYGAAGRASRGGNFLDRRIAEVRDGAAIEVARDQLASPSYAPDLAAAACELALDMPWQGGLYHLVNEGPLSWYEFTRLAFAACGWEDRVRPVARHGQDGVLRRPLNSALASTRARARGVTLPSVADAVRRYLSEVYPELLAAGRTGDGSGHPVQAIRA